MSALDDPLKERREEIADVLIWHELYGTPGNYYCLCGRDFGPNPYERVWELHLAAVLMDKFPGLRGDR